MSSDQAAPFTSLTPEFLLRAMESLGLSPDGRLLALNSYENRVYQMGMVDGPPLVVKFYRPLRWSDEAIREEHEFLAELADREIPVVPALVIEGNTLHEFEDARFAVFRKQGGRAPEFDRHETLGWMGRFMGRIHSIGALRPFRARPALDVASFGDEPLEHVLASCFLPDDLFNVYCGVAEQALEGTRRCFELAGSTRALRLHGDCHVGNVLWTDAGPHFVDFDDARMGPAVQDLWMLLSGDRADMAAQLSEVLEGYRRFHDFDSRELHLIEALRTLRLIHHSAWIAQRWDDPAFPMAFPWFDSPRYWQDRILELREQIALMDEGPLLLD